MRLPTPLLLLIASSLIGEPGASAITRLEFLGQARIPAGSVVEETAVGGLSGITYDASRDLYYVVSDDPSARASARYYGVEVDLGEGRLAEDGTRIVGVTSIQSPGGGPMPAGSLDAEGIAFHPDGSLYISSEGQIRQGVAPFVRRFARNGQYLGELPLPDRYRPAQDGSRGPRHNLGFESLAVTQDGRVLFTALENALVEDGPEAAVGVASPSRLLRFDLSSGQVTAEYLYWTEPVVAPASVADGLEVAGVVDLLALDELHLLSLERSFSMGVGNAIRIFLVGLAGATDLRDYPTLKEVNPDGVESVHKELLLDLADLGIYLDNLEGMTFGPRLSDGRRTLVLVSDDNFNPLIQSTQFLAFALGDEPVTVESLQGANHRSPLEGQWVRGVPGVVTGTYPGERAGFWMESAEDDGNRATSRGVLVIHDGESEAWTSGQRVAVDGRVVEDQRQGDLSVTTVQASRISVLERGLALPPPVAVGRGGLPVPSEVVDNDGMRVFEPQFDGLDFWESLEGMRIVLAEARVVGPTNRYGELTVDASGRLAPSASSRAGGLLLRPGDLNPERLTVDFSCIGEPPDVDVGARSVDGLKGVIGYRFGTYRVYVQGPTPQWDSKDRRPETTDLTPGHDRLTVATFNVLNLDAKSPQDRYRALARTLAVSLRGPDIVALQEIQDDSGSADDGTVSAARTLMRLIDAVSNHGGPDYEYRQIDPVNNRDGGQPGSNIRPAFLFNPDRVSFVSRGPAGPSEPVRLVAVEGGVGLSANPGRIGPQEPAFDGDEERGFSPSRKPLVAELRFGAHQLLVVNNHWSSKGSDDPTFGEAQPPIRHSEDQRAQQARLVSDFVAEALSLDSHVGIIVLGDFNDHEFRTPLRVLTETPLENLAFQLSPEDRYSFNYRGNSQLLDHILLSRFLLERARARVDIVHGNSDLAHARSSSDHDPMIVELDYSPVD